MRAYGGQQVNKLAEVSGGQQVNKLAEVRMRAESTTLVDIGCILRVEYVGVDCQITCHDESVTPTAVGTS